MVVVDQYCGTLSVPCSATLELTKTQEHSSPSDKKLAQIYAVFFVGPQSGDSSDLTYQFVVSDLMLL